MNYINNLTEIKIDKNIKAIFFDCFGTLMEIKDKQKPYKNLLSYLSSMGYINNNYAKMVMTKTLSLEDIQKETGIKLPEEIKTQFTIQLNQELKSICLFPETNDVLWMLKNKDIKIGLCSNLASPYGKDAKTKTILLDKYILSYDVGYIKPEKEIFSACQNAMNLQKNEILFIGDNENDDYKGAINYGFNALCIRRK